MFYKYYNLDNNYTFKNLEDNSLYFNIVNYFNDPFDSFPNIKMSQKTLKNNLKKRPEFSNKKEKSIPTIKSDKITILSHSFPLTKLFGITCFSSNSCNLLMWSHYSNSHKGICLGFDINENNLYDFILNSDDIYLMLKRVTYLKNRPQIIFSNNNKQNFPKKFTEAILIKDTLWRYEEEYRLIAHNKTRDKNRDKNFPKILYYNPSFLKEFILGSQMPLNKFFELHKLILKLLKKNSNLKIKLCYPDTNKFAIKTKNITDISILYSNCKYLLDTVQKNYSNDNLDNIPMYIILIFFPEIIKKNLNNISKQMCNEFYNIYNLYNL